MRQVRWRCWAFPCSVLPLACRALWAALLFHAVDTPQVTLPHRRCIFLSPCIWLPRLPWSVSNPNWFNNNSLAKNNQTNKFTGTGVKITLCLATVLNSAKPKALQSRKGRGQAPLALPLGSEHRVCGPCQGGVGVSCSLAYNVHKLGSTGEEKASP